ncbi:MAG: HAMP domain-containing protein [Chloroflexi bacterium]|nr:HAMP domain-containing protein [Chloroflexota bacterium]
MGGPRWGWGGRGPRRHGPIARRIGCLFVVVATVLVSTGVLVLWLIATLLGAIAAEGSLGGLVRAAAVVLLAVLFIGLAAGLRFTGRMVRPITELVDAAGRIEAGDYSARVATPARTPRDLRALTGAFNTMAARLEAEEELRRRLLADLGHELRTPIAVIEGHLEAILDGVYPGDREHLDPILDETRVLERLVDDLRTVSLAEAGSLPLHREPVDLGHVVADVVAALGHRAEVAGVRLTTEVDAALPELELDPVRIHQVLSNLVDNAIRYTPRDGTVRISAARRGSGSGPGPGSEVELAVTDDGPGLSPELRDTLFDRFVKSPDSPGSGLGLAIARGIVDAHGGAIRAAPASPHGTRIVVTLPVA